VLVGLTSQNLVLLASAVIPPVLALGVYWFGFRWARRHDEQHGRDHP
jgi:hypothetical protein